MRILFTIAALVLMSAVPALAQTRQDKASANERTAGELLAKLVELDDEIDDKFDKASDARSGVPLAKELFSLGELTKNTRQVGNVNLFLVRAHDLYRDIKKDTKCREDDPRPICGDLADLDHLTHRLLSERGLGWSMAAILRTGLMVGDAGEGAREFFDRSELVSKTFGASYVDFELPHWGDGVNLFDVTVNGHMGYAPVAALVRKRPASNDAEQNKLTALYMPGYTWGSAVRANAQLGKSELSAFVSTGADRLADLSIKLGTDDMAGIGDVLRNDVGRWSWRHSVGLEYRYFGADLGFVHHDASRLLTPRLSLAVSYQYVERFKATEDLKDFGKPARLNSRISVNIVEWVRDTAAEGKSNDPLTVRVVFENDYPLTKEQPRAPSGNRLYIEANADLLKAFGFGQDKGK